MTDQNLTEIIVIMDRSGSMQGIRADMEGGYNRLIEDLKKTPGEKRVTLTQFDDVYEVVYSAMNINEVPPLELAPRGWTALLDAIGRTIDDVGKRLRRVPEHRRPAKVVVVIITDGQENASKHFHHHTIMQKIAHQRDKYAWEFVFLGANQDAIAVAKEMGIFYAQNFAASPAGAAAAYTNVSHGLQDYVSLNANELKVAKTSGRVLGRSWQNK